MTLQHGNRIRENSGRQVARELQDIKALELANDAPTEAEIRQRAYEIYLGRNGSPGSPEVDWLEAECELGARRVTAPQKGKAE